MGLFGRTASDSVLPFYQKPKPGVLNGSASYFVASRRASRSCERCLIFFFFIFFIAIFVTTIYFLPDLSTKMHSVGKDFLVPERSDGFASQIKRPRKPFLVPSDSPAGNQDGIQEKERLKSELDGKIHRGDHDVDRSEVENAVEITKTDFKKPHVSSDAEMEKRRQLIIKMMKHAWGNYVQYAWGANELRPVTKRGHNPSIFGKAKFGATIVDATDTLYMMGLFDEYKRARDWISANLNVSASEGEVSVFEFNIRYIGGLLSSYALTGDKMFLRKADEMASAILPAFETPTGIPYAILDLKQKKMKNYGWASGGSSILAEFGSLHLEFTYLSKMTGKSVYTEKVKKIRDHLAAIDKPKGMYPNYLNPQTGKWGQMHVSIGALGDSFYEYLFKSWLFSDKTDNQAKQMFDEAMEAMEKQLLQTSKGGLRYWGDYVNNRVEHKMDHLSCFSGGLYGLSAKHAKDPQHYLTLAKEITKTCHESYSRSRKSLLETSSRIYSSAGRDVKSTVAFCVGPTGVTGYLVGTVGCIVASFCLELVAFSFLSNAADR